MRSMIKLDFPFTAAKVSQLKVGDLVSLSGRLATGRDRFHRFLAAGGESPVPLRDGAIYHCGPVAIQQGDEWVIRAAGPTTSLRMERHMAALLALHQVRVVIGKGGMGEESRQAFMQHGCVYLQAVGGAAGVIAGCIERVSGVHFAHEFGMAEAVWDLHVSRLDAVVTMDTRGRSLHKRVGASSKRALAALMT